MEELSLHILDIAQNSIAAGACYVYISVVYEDELVTITITDDGCGMDEETVCSIIDPFATSRTTRKIGLGIPLLKEGCERTGGSFSITSQKGEGTKVIAAYKRDSFDRPPLGNIGQTMAVLICCNAKVEFEFICKVKNMEYTLTTKEIKDVLGDVPLNNPEIANFIERDIYDWIRYICVEEIL